MIPELEKPRVIEINVRMDCNGCVQKIKKALHGITGIYDTYIDLPQQKVTIIGWADLEKIVKAIKKTRKIATICAHIEPSDPPAQHSEQPPVDAATPAPDTTDPTPEEPPKDPPPPENPSLLPTDSNAEQKTGQSKPKEIEEVHVIYHHPPGYSYRYGMQGSNYQPIYATHNYNTYRPVRTEYEYVRSPPRYAHYSRNEDYRVSTSSSSSNNTNITSIFSDENPNACRIV